jgi:mannose-6-phosphate isomerase-like protein (cupin superfamily)
MKHKMEIIKVNIESKFNEFHDFWNPRIVGELNGQHIKLARLKGEFVMHQHENEDEMFLVLEGLLQMEMEDKTLNIYPGEFVIIPKGTMHKPITNDEVKVMLFEPKTTLNTGNVENDFTRTDLDEI